MIFLTVGPNAPFDRLVRAMDDLLDTQDPGDEIYAQIGDSTYRPRHFPAVPWMSPSVFDRHLQQASAVISHAGMGTIRLACEWGKPLLVMPRQRALGEAAFDYQRALAARLEAGGHLLVAHDVGELATKLIQLKSFVPEPRDVDPGGVAERIERFVRSADRHCSRR